METAAFTITLIIGILVAVFAGVAALFGALGGIKRTAVNFVCMLIALVLAFVLSAPAAKAAAQKLEPLTGSVSDEVAEEMPTLAAIMDGMIDALLTPAVFFALFLVFAIMFAVIGAIVSRCVFGRREWDRGAVSRLCGLGVGLLGGILVISVLLIPICGYASLVSDTAAALAAREADASFEIDGEQNDDIDPEFGYGDIPVSSVLGEVPGVMDEVTPILDVFCNVGYMRLIKAAGGGAVFDALCRVEIPGGESEPLSDILPETAVLVIDALPLAEVAPEEYGERQCAALDAVAADMESNEPVSAVVAEVLSAVSESWLEGRAFLGVECPAMDARIRPVAEALMRSLENIDSSLLRESLPSVVEILKLMIKNKDLLGSDGMSDILRSGELVSEFLEIADGCELLRAAADAARSAGVGYVGEKLGLTEEESAEARELAGKIAESVSRALDGEDPAAADRLCEEIKKTAADHGIEISDELLPMAGDYMLDIFENMSDVTADDIFSMFAAAANAVGAEN